MTKKPAASAKGAEKVSAPALNKTTPALSAEEKLNRLIAQLKKHGIHLDEDVTEEENEE